MNREQAGAAKQQAIANGELKYDGMACKTCGGTLRYTAHNSCVPCKLARAQEWRARNPEKQRQCHENWRNNNREYLRVYYKMQHLRAKEQTA